MEDQFVSGAPIRTETDSGRGDRRTGVGNRRQARHCLAFGTVRGSCTFTDAGHAIRVPYRFDEDVLPEDTPAGGTHEAHARASARAWQAALRYLNRGLPAVA
jgi:hypothetical protein